MRNKAETYLARRPKPLPWIQGRDGEDVRGVEFASEVNKMRVSAAVFANEQGLPRVAYRTPLLERGSTGPCMRTLCLDEAVALATCLLGAVAEALHLERPEAAAAPNQTLDALIRPAARKKMLAEIQRNQGLEIMFIGDVDKGGAVCSVIPACYGNWMVTGSCIESAAPGQVLIHNHPEGPILPSEQDVIVASRAIERGVGFYITNNFLSGVHVVARPNAINHLNLSEGGAVT